LWSPDSSPLIDGIGDVAEEGDLVPAPSSEPQAARTPARATVETAIAAARVRFT
jgi:hypothetical protein